MMVSKMMEGFKESGRTVSADPQRLTFPLNSQITEETNALQDMESED